MKESARKLRVCRMHNPDQLWCLQRKRLAAPINRCWGSSGKKQHQPLRAKSKRRKTGHKEWVGHSEPPRWRQIQERPVIQGLEPRLRYRLGTREKGQDHREEPDARGGTKHHHSPPPQHYPGRSVGPEDDSKMGSGEYIGYELGHKLPFIPHDAEAGGGGGQG